MTLNHLPRAARVTDDITGATPGGRVVDRKRPRWPDVLAVICFGVAVLVVVLNAVAYVDRLGIGWDEHTDLGIARSFEHDWLAGSGRDPSQGRLPMYLGFIVFSITGQTSLTAARLLSLPVALATLAGCYMVVRSLTGDFRLACFGGTFLALNPFFLSYVRTAFTESDLYPAAFLVWGVYFALRAFPRPTLMNAFATAVAFGLAISCKVTMLAFLPALAVVGFGPAPGQAYPRKAYLLPLCILTALLSGVVLVWALPLLWIADWHLLPSCPAFIRTTLQAYDGLSHGAKLIHFIAVLSVWCMAMGVFVRYRAREMPRWAWMLLVVLAAGCVALAFPPSHVVRPSVYGEALLRILEPRSNLPDNWVGNNAAFHIACIMFKSGPVLGAALLGGFIYCLGMVVARKASRPTAMLTLGIALLFLVVLKIDYLQTFYTVPLLPLLVCCLCLALFEFGRRAPRVAPLFTALLIVTTGAAHARLFPDYNLSGYAWIGPKGLANRAGIGYVGVSVVPYDGVEQSLRWLLREAPAGARVATFIAYGLKEDLALDLVPPGRLEIADARDGGAAEWRDADFLVTTLELETARELPFEYPMCFHLSHSYNTPGRTEITKRFVEVFRVQRALGLEVATVWVRREQITPVRGTSVPAHPSSTKE